MSGTADQQMEMPCLGRPFQLGTLYDFRNDNLIPGVTLWGPETLGTATCTKMEGSDFEVITEDSLNEKALHLDVSAGLKLSVLGGLVKAGGSGKFLYDRTTSKNQARVSLKYRATSRFEQLNMSHLGKFEYPRVFDDDIATHVVTGVQYGADAIFVFDRLVESSEKLKQVHGNLEAMIKALPSFDLNVGGSADLDIQKKEKKGVEEIHCKFYGDFILPKNPTTYQDAVRVYQELPKLLGGVGYPNSVPKKVWLYPLSKLDSKVHRLVREISSWLIDDVQELLESLHELEIQTNDLIQNEVCSYFHESKGDLKKLKRLIGSYRITLLRRLSTLLPQLRGGHADETKLAELLKENRISPFSWERLSSWISGKELETSTLAVYLEELKEHQIQFAFSSAEMVVITKNFNKETILCFDFNILAGNDSCLQKMEAYLREETVSQELQVQKSWYKTREMRQAFQRFVNFVKTNTGREGVKYVVTNGSGDTTESIEKVGVLFMYEDACPTMFEPPDQPGKPQALSVTHNSIQLKWDKPNYGATSVQSYTAAYCTSDDPIDQWCTQASDEECLELTNLTPGSLYFFKVTAETSVGSSPTSEVSEAIQLPPDQPGKPHASEKNYNCVQLKWSKPKHGTNIVQYYTVLYQSTDAQWCKKTSEEEFSILTNLTPGSLYSFKVVAESSAGSSPSSEVCEVQLPPDHPGKPLTTEVTHNSVQLKWDKPKHGNRIVECYKFFHRLADNPPREWLIQEIDKECLYLKKLTPGSLYYFKVTAESSAGSSPESAVNEVWLPPDQPGKPEYQGMTHNSLQLKWSKPKHGADIVQSYTVSYHSVDSPVNKWCTQTSSEECLVLTKLTPGLLYHIKVAANSSAGSSPVSEMSKVRLPPGQPGKPHASRITHSSIRLEWSKPKHGAEIVKYYTLSYQSTDDQWCKTTREEKFLLHTNLTPGSLYSFKVVAESLVGSSPSSEVTEVQLPPDQPGKPEILDITHNSIQLQWFKPKHGAGIVTSYIVSYSSVDNLQDQWCTQASIKECSVLVTKLIPGMLYCFKVTADSPAGLSPASEVREIRLPPDQPGKPVASDATYNSVCLKWTKPKHGAETVQSYSISCQAVDNQCYNISTTSKHECVTLTKLTPKTVYTFKVRAVSAAGHGPDSELSDPIQTTLPPPGKPHASNVTHNSLQLNWEEPSHGADSVEFYTVSYRTGNISLSQWDTERTPVAVESIQLGSLLSKTIYYFKVRAESATGPSPDSDLSDPIETVSPISQPGKPTATKVTHDSIALKWEKPEHGADDVKYYILNYYALDQQDRWFTYKRLGSQASVCLTGLQPQTIYMFKVRAESSVVSSLDSKHSDPIETSKLSPPGRPYASNVSYTSFQVNWQLPCYGDIHHYIVSYRTTDELSDNWHKVKTDDNNSSVFFNGTEGTFYVFKVAAVTAAGVSSDSEVSDVIQTKAIPLICKGLDPISKSNPLTYLLPTHCVMEKHGISKVHVGVNSHGIITSGVHTSCSCHTRTQGVPHKVLMLVGATGAGKTTLINGMANYIMGVQWDDDLRFKLIHEPNSQDQTPTRCITSYTFYKEKDSPLPYTLTVIDTPGFGEVNRDKQIFKQIKKLFSIEGFDQLHGIGFVTQAPIRQLTPTQQYVCDTTLSMFGKDVADNIFLMITFANGLKLPVLDVVKAAKVPYQEFFVFNNSALLANTSADDEFNKMLWRIGVYGFVEFFQKFSTAKAKSLRLSIKVIQEYETLERAIQGMHYAVPVFRGSPVFTMQREMQELACRSIKELQEIALKPNYLFKVKYIDLIIETEKREAKPRWLDRVRALEGVQQQAKIVTKLIENPGSEKNSEPRLGVSRLFAKSILSLSGIYK